MAEATLSAPHTINPTQATRLRVRATRNDHVGRKIGVTIDYLDAAGNVVFTETDQLDGPAVNAHLTNAETSILNRYLTKKGLTGTVA